MIKYWNKHKKNLDFWDIGLIKSSVAALVLFIITIWSAAMTWVQSVNTWYFLIAALIFGARPFYKYYIK